MYTENLWSPLDPKCLETFAENPLKCPLLWVSAFIAAVSQHELWYTEMGVLLLFPFYPQMAAFLPLFYLPVSQIVPIILSFAPVSGGPCHFRKSLSPYSGKPVGDSTKTQCYLAIRIMVEEVLVYSYIKHLEDELVAQRNLKIGFWG